MKKILFFIPILFILACNTQEDQTLLYLNEGIDIGNQLLEYEQWVSFQEFKIGEIDYPKRNYDLMQKSETILDNCDKINLLVKEIIENSTSDKNKSIIKTTNYKTVELFEKILEFQNYLLISCPDIEQNILEEIDIENCKTQEITIALLNIISNKISFITYIALNNLEPKIIKPYSYNFWDGKQ